MDPTQPDKNQVPQAPLSTGMGAVAGTKEAPITINTSNTSNSALERPAGVEPSYPEIHETAGGFIQPNPSAKPPIAEIQTQLNEMGEKMPITSHLNVSPERAHQLTKQPVNSGSRWLGTLIEKINKITDLFRNRQPIRQS